MSPPDMIRPLSVSLEAVAAELADMVLLGGKLESVISRLAARGEAPDPELLSDCQAADLLSQRLAGVAAFVDLLARAAPAGAVTDLRAALACLPLAEQARRLTGTPAAPAACAAHGEALFFED